MPRPRLPYLQRESARGRVFWYVRVSRDLPRVRIKGEYGSPEFMADYQAAVAGQQLPNRSLGKDRKGTLAWLVAEWKKSSASNLASPATRKQRDNILLHVLEKSGDKPFAAITEQHIQAGMEKRQKTPFAANNFLKTMRALFQWAKKAKHVKVDPTRDVETFSRATDGFTPWNVEDVAAFRARWPLGTRERVAFEVLFNTGLRRSDAVRLGRQHVRDGVATITTMKNNAEVYFPIMPALTEAIEAGPVGDLAFIVGERGLPRTKESFGNWFREACAETGLPKGKSAHGVRKLLATILADDGASDWELMALFGWKTKDQSTVYTKNANNKKLALKAALRMMGGDERENKSATVYSLTPENVREGSQKSQ